MNLLAAGNNDRTVPEAPLRVLHRPDGKWVFTGRHQPRPVPGGLLAIKPIYRWHGNAGTSPNELGSRC